MVKGIQWEKWLLAKTRLGYAYNWTTLVSMAKETFIWKTFYYTALKRALRNLIKKGKFVQLKRGIYQRARK